jgi:hypothetical protein
MADLRLRNNEWLLENVPDADNLDWKTVDLSDGSWTQSDPSGIILNTASTVSEITKVTYNAYKSLELADGVVLNTDDPYIASFQLSVETPTAQDRVNILIGLAEAPTSNTIATMNFSGQMLEYTSTTSNRFLGPYIATGNPSLAQNTNNKMGFTSFASITNRLGNLSAFNLDSSAAFIAEKSLTASRTYTASTNLFIVVLAGINGVNTIGACDIQAKLRYRIVKFSGLPL